MVRGIDMTLSRRPERSKRRSWIIKGRIYRLRQAVECATQASRLGCPISLSEGSFLCARVGGQRQPYRRSLLQRRELRYQGRISLDPTHILRRYKSRLIPKRHATRWDTNYTVRRCRSLNIYKVQANSAPAYSARLPAVLASMQSLITFQMTFSAC